jgi:hypothetical protein
LTFGRRGRNDGGVVLGDRVPLSNGFDTTADNPSWIDVLDIYVAGPWEASSKDVL